METIINVNQKPGVTVPMGENAYSWGVKGKSQYANDKCYSTVAT